jgi:hypothetical protein
MLQAFYFFLGKARYQGYLPGVGLTLIRQDAGLWYKRLVNFFDFVVKFLSRSRL